MIDLNKKRAARKREAKREPVKVKLGDDVFTLPAELPFECVALLSSLGDDDANAPEIFRDVLRVLLGSQFEAFLSHAPSMTDVVEMVNGLTEEYGITLGESEASAES